MNLRSLSLAFSLPLLEKELQEQAARRRTYVVRSVYALGLFLAFLLLCRASMRAMPDDPASTLSFMGMGRELFRSLLAIQFVGIFLFLPAMMAGAITSEKERGSLPLLLMTDLRPWELLLQKYVGRLIPMFSFLLLSVPLMAVAYAYGGITATQVLNGAWLLFVTCLQVGAFALMCSCGTHSTALAIVGTYLPGAFFYILPFLALAVLRSLFNVYAHPDEALLFAWVPMYHLFELILSYRPVSFPEMVVRSLGIPVTAGVFLLVARLLLVRQAFVRGRSLGSHFRGLDQAFQALNNKVAGGREYFCERTTLPEEEPVAWRETATRALGRRTHLVRLVLLLELPALFVAFLVMAADGGSGSVLTVLTVCLWIIVGLIVVTQGTNLVAAERSDQTLEVLLTTPLSAREIVTQKMRALRRLLIVLAIPLVTMALLRALVPGPVVYYQYTRIEAMPYLAKSVAAWVIFLPLLAWVSVWIGMAIRNRTRAIVTALAVVAGWTVGLPILLFLLRDFTAMSRDMADALVWMSPGWVMVEIETGSKTDFTLPIGLLVFGSYTLALYLVRALCLAQAERHLRGFMGWRPR